MTVVKGSCFKITPDNIESTKEEKSVTAIIKHITINLPTKKLDLLIG